MQIKIFNFQHTYEYLANKASQTLLDVIILITHAKNLYLPFPS